MTKITKKTHDTDIATGDSALRMASSMLNTGLQGLEAYVKHIAGIVGESKDIEVAESFAHLLTKIAQVASELRKAEAAERKAASEISRPEMIEAARRMDSADRARFVRELQAIDTKRSGLA